MPVYAALVVSPRALPDGLILVFQHPVNALERIAMPVCLKPARTSTGKFDEA
jgi:hypothetical protein